VSRTIVLVTQDEVTQSLFEQACASSLRLRSHVVEGSLAEGDGAIEAVETLTGGREPLLAMFAPRSSTESGAVEFTTKLGFAAPLDDDGRCWITRFAMPSQATEEETLAVLDVIRILATGQHGYLIVDGEYTPLDGVPDPTPSPLPKPTPNPAPTLFAKAMFARRTAGTEGWRWLHGRMLMLAGPHLTPQRVSVNGGWEDYKPGTPDTDTGRVFERSQPWAHMHVMNARYPHQWYSSVFLDAEGSSTEGEALLERLLALVPDGLEYAAVAWWHDEDETVPHGLRRPDSGPSWAPRPIPPGEPLREFSFVDRTLTKCLPDLYWAQIVGPPWVELWGADRIASTPAYRVEEVAPSTWLIQLTPHLADVTDDRDNYVAIRTKAKEHLGEDTFFDRERGHYAEYRAPRIPTLGERGLA